MNIRLAYIIEWEIEKYVNQTVLLIFVAPFLSILTWVFAFNPILEWSYIVLLFLALAITQSNNYRRGDVKYGQPVTEEARERAFERIVADFKRQNKR